MASKATVNMTFAGDSSDLEGAFDRVGQSARDIEGDFATAQSNMADFDVKMANAANTGDVAEQAFRGVGDILGFVGDQTGLPVDGLAEMSSSLAGAAGGVATLLPLIGQMPGALKAIGAALITPPLGVVVAIGAAVAALVILYQKSETFRNIVNGAFSAVRDVAVEVFDKVKGAAETAWNWISNNWPLILGILTGPIAPVILAFTTFRDDILGIVDKVVGFFRDMPGRILDALGDLGSTLWNAGRDLIQGFIDGIKSMAGEVGSAIADAIPGGGLVGDAIGGIGDAVGFIGHQGGVVPGNANENVLSVLRGGERVLTPHQSAGGTTIIVNASGYVRSIDELVADIDRARRRRLV